jgi:hypothetical protein
MNKKVTNAGEDMEEKKPLYTIDRNTNEFSHCGKQ